MDQTAEAVTSAWVEELLARSPFPQQESVMVLTATTVKIVEPLTHRLLHQNPTSVIDPESMMWVKWPKTNERRSVHGDLAASAMRMTEQQRTELLRMVSSKQVCRGVLGAPLHIATSHRLGGRDGEGKWEQIESEERRRERKRK